MNFDQFTGRLAERYGVSEEAVLELRGALERGGGRLAQFFHPDLGGHGPWMPGMTQIGDMFNHGLRNRVERLCQELSEYAPQQGMAAAAAERGSESASSETYSMKPMKPMKPMEPMKPMQGMKPMEPMKPPQRWWPEELGAHPNSAGGQNEARYAFFADRRRLAVDTGDGKVQVFDTGEHHISGVQQHQSGGGQKVTFTSQHGEVELAKLRAV